MPLWSRIAATAALCCALSAAVVQVPIHSALATFPPRKGGGSVAEYRTVELAIGMPAQTFNLTLDFASNYAQVFAKNFTVTPTQCTPKSENRRRFDSTASKSYHYLGANFSADINENYFRGCWNAVEPARKGVVAYDYVTIKNFSTWVNFGVVLKDEFGSPQPYWPSDGVLGFQRLYPGNESAESTLYSLARAAGQPQVTLFGGDSANGHAGVLTLGGPDAVNCASKWTRIYQADGAIDDWELEIKGFQFGAYKLSNPEWNGLISAGAKTGVPPKVFKQIVKMLGAEYDFASDEYVVDCNAAKSAPAIVIQLASDAWPPNTHEYRIPASAFAANLTNRKDKKCTLLFFETDPEFVDWYLGWNALSGNCWMFDYGPGEFAFAKAKQ
ncbi:Protein ASP-7 [Aphelenchoides avenae]|nr:Protein ASP-7 [Aphelenchus avenae]